jgi:hypothetical protein
MQQIMNPTIGVHTIYRNQGAYISALVLTHGDNKYHIQGATTDTIHVFMQGIAIYILITNKDRDYIGMASYMLPESDPINTVFIHTHQEIRETLGKHWETMSPLFIIKKLIDYLM